MQLMEAMREWIITNDMKQIIQHSNVRCPFYSVGHSKYIDAIFDRACPRDRYH